MTHKDLDTSHVTHLAQVDIHIETLYLCSLDQLAQLTRQSVASGEGQQKRLPKPEKASSETAPSGFAEKYIVDPSKREAIMHTLHEMMDRQTKPSLKLLPLRAAVEAGVLMSRIAYMDAVAEFGRFDKTTFSNWMKRSEYAPNEIDPIIAAFRNY